MIKDYELTLAVSPTLSGDEIKALETKIGQLVEGLGGQAGPPQKLDNVELAYPLKKNYSAHFFVIAFTLAPEKVEEFRASLKPISQLWRYLISLAPSQGKRQETTKSKPKTIKKTSPQKIEDKPKSTKTTKEPEAMAKKKTTEAVKIEEIDKKLDEILEG